MSWFDNKDKKNERKLTLGLGLQRFVADDKYLSYRGDKSFRILKSDIESVSLDSEGFATNKVRINGKGTLLAEIKLPKDWAEKVQDFILNELKDNNQKDSLKAFDEIERLATLKDKGIITEDEFEKKKKLLLGI